MLSFLKKKKRRNLASAAALPAIDNPIDSNSAHAGIDDPLLDAQIDRRPLTPMEIQQLFDAIGRHQEEEQFWLEPERIAYEEDWISPENWPQCRALLELNGIRSSPEVYSRSVEKRTKKLSKNSPPFENPFTGEFFAPADHRAIEQLPEGTVVGQWYRVDENALPTPMVGEVMINGRIDPFVPRNRPLQLPRWGNYTVYFLEQTPGAVPRLVVEQAIPERYAFLLCTNMTTGDHPVMIAWSQRSETTAAIQLGVLLSGVDMQTDPNYRSVQNFLEEERNSGAVIWVLLACDWRMCGRGTLSEKLIWLRDACGIDLEQVTVYEGRQYQATPLTIGMTGQGIWGELPDSR